MTRIYTTTFAATGDKETLAATDPGTGKVSLPSGWTPDYEKLDTDPSYRPVGRKEMNGVINEVTAAVGELQQYGFAPWQALTGGWPLNARVVSGGIVYKSTAAANTAVPPAAPWVMDAAADINSAPAKPVLADADELGVTDSANSFGLVKVTWANLKGQLAGTRNKIINGKMEIAQRGTSFAAAGSGYHLDRWQFAADTSAVVTVSQQNDAPTNTGFQNSLRYAVTTADTSLSASDYFLVSQIIEGYNVRDLVGKPFTISFWVRSSNTGIHCLSFRNAGPDRSYIAEYTVNAANTWEYKTITITGGLPSVGTWNYSNGLGLGVSFIIAAGATFKTTPSAWQTGNFLATNNQVNCLNTAGNIFAITGVQLEVGTVATSFEHRPHGMELALCQRYVQIVYGGYGGSAIVGNNQSCAVAFPVPMRAAPSVTWLNTEFSVNFTATAPAFWNVISHGMRMLKTASGSGQDSAFIERLLLNAEL